MSNKPKIVLCILDGLGIREEVHGNTLKMTKTPNLDYMMENYPMSYLGASGEDVGLPKGQMGNSEVGHLNIGSGRIVYQSLSLINKSIENLDFFKNEAFLEAIEYQKKHNSNLHLFSLYSSGGVHSHMEHLFAMLQLLKNEQVNNVYLHLFLDGRDVSPQSAKKDIEKLKRKLKQLNIGLIATVIGRYYAMDRDKNFKRNLLAYECIVNKKGNKFSDPLKYLEDQYATLPKNGFEASDEFVLPGRNKKYTSGIKDNDAIIFLNFRPDRAIQLSTLITNPEFYEGYKIEVNPLNNIFFVSMMKYADSVKGEIAFKNKQIKNTLGEILAERNYSQLRLAETEKYAHVTYFFDGRKKYDGIEKPLLKKSKRILIDSPKVATYDLMPKMSAYKISKTLNEAIKQKKYDVIVVNFANLDMVGHTAIEEACIKAVQVVDECVGVLYETCKNNDYTLLLTADHGNIEKIVDENNEPFSAHTTSKVPFIINQKDVLLKDGILSDIAVTILSLLNEEIPKEMTGKNLIIGKERK